jgi:hypothetical protein
MRFAFLHRADADADAVQSHAPARIQPIELRSIDARRHHMGGAAHNQIGDGDSTETVTELVHAVL